MRKFGIVLAAVAISAAAVASNISITSTSAEGGNLSENVSLQLDLDSEFYLVVNGIYNKDDSSSWAGEKTYMGGAGYQGGVYGGEVDFTAYNGTQLYFSRMWTFTGSVKFTEWFKPDGGIFAEKCIWDDLSSKLSFSYNVDLNEQGDIFVLVKKKLVPANWKVTESYFTLSFTETVFKDTVLKASYSEYRYDKALSTVNTAVINQPGRLGNLSGTISGFPSYQDYFGGTQYLFDLGYLKFEYTFTGYVLTAPSDSYTLTAGVYLWKGFELNGAYNQYFDPDRIRTDSYSAGVVIDF